MELTTVGSDPHHNNHSIEEFTFIDYVTDDVDTSNVTLITSGPVFDAYEKAAFEVYIYPLFILLAFIFVGLIGNCFVLYIFTFRWERTKTSVFIITLAVLDIANCSINMPIEVSILWKPFSFDHDLFCKASRCFSYINTAAYSFVLVAVAYDRYLMICKPLKRMVLGTRYATRTCIAAVLVAIVTQLPSFFLYGTFTFKYPVMVTNSNATTHHSNASYSATGSNVTEPGLQAITPENKAVYVEGRTCLVTNYYYYENRLPTFLFQGFLFLCHVIIFITLTVVYIVIGRRLFMSSHVDIEDSGARQGLLTRSIMSALTGNPNMASRRNSSMTDVTRRSRSSQLRHSTGDNLSYSPANRRTSLSTAQSIRSPKMATCRSLIALPRSKSVERDRHAISRNNVIVYVDNDNGSPNGGRNPVTSCTEEDQEDVFVENGAETVKHSVLTIKRSLSLDIGRLYSINSNTLTPRPNIDIKELSLKRNTLIMRMVTFTFILSYLPFLVLVTLRYSDKSIPTKLSKHLKIVYHVFLRSYFLNSVIRPFIYIVMNERYRAKVFLLAKQCLGIGCR